MAEGVGALKCCLPGRCLGEGAHFALLPHIRSCQSSCFVAQSHPSHLRNPCQTNRSMHSFVLMDTSLLFVIKKIPEMSKQLGGHFCGEVDDAAQVSPSISNTDHFLMLLVGLPLASVIQWFPRRFSHDATPRYVITSSETLSLLRMTSTESVFLRCFCLVLVFVFASDSWQIIYFCCG